MIEGPIVREITSAIERMEADPEYQQYYKDHEEEATKDDLKKPDAAKAKAAPKTSAKTAKKSTKKPAKRTPSTKGGK